MPLLQQLVGPSGGGVGAGGIGRALQDLLQSFCGLQYAHRVGLADARGAEE